MLPMLYQSTPTEILKLKTFDSFVKKQETSGNFVILNITEDDVEKEGGYPFPRKRLGEIHNTLIDPCHNSYPAWQRNTCLSV